MAIVTADVRARLDVWPFQTDFSFLRQEAGPPEPPPRVTPVPKPTLLVEPKPAAKVEPKPAVVEAKKPAAKVEPKPAAVEAKKPAAVEAKEPAAVEAKEPAAVEAKKPAATPLELRSTDKGWALFTTGTEAPLETFRTKRRALGAAKRKAEEDKVTLSVFTTAGELQKQLDFTGGADA